MSDDKQARFSRSRDHIFLRPEKRKREPKPPKKGKKKKGHPFPSRSTVEYQTLKSRVSGIHRSASERTRIMESKRFHFIIELSDKITWKTISNSIQKLGVTIVKYIDDKTIRVSLKREAYEGFLSNLEKNSRFIQNIREIGVFEKIDRVLREEILQKPEGKTRVSIEFFNIDVENPELVEESLITWIEKGNYGNLERSYLSGTTLLLSGLLVNRCIETMANEIESLAYISKIPEMELEGFHGETSIALSSVIPLGEISKRGEQEPLQAVVVIDSGINRDHKLLNNYIDDTYDYSTDSRDPCTDNLCHGSSVSGLVIYGGDLRKSKSPSARVIAVKNFERRGEINQDVIRVIQETMEKYKFVSRVINLSFSSRGPNHSLTKVLDEMVFLSDYVVVVSSGNIRQNAIASFLNAGVQYPDYIDNQIVFFPADCRNVVTVGSHTENSSNFVLKDYPSPFTKSGFSRTLIKPDVMAPGGNLELSKTPSGIAVTKKRGLGIISASHVNDQHIEQFGTSFSSPIVASIAASIIQRRVDFSTFLVKALLISSCEQVTSMGGGSAFPATLQGFGKVNKTRAVFSQDWRVCYLFHGEFDSGNSDEFHQYRFLFPDQADQLEVTAVCGKLVTGHSQEIDDYLHLFFNRPGVKLRTRLRRGVRVGARKCSCTYREKVRIERGSKGPWTCYVYPHFSTLPIPQRLKYGIVIAVSNSKGNDVYSAVAKWIEPQKARILVPTIVESISRT